MAKIEFKSGDGLGEYQVNEPTRDQLSEIVYMIRRAGFVSAEDGGRSLHKLLKRVSGIDTKALTVVSEVRLLDELGAFYFELAGGDQKKEPA